MSDVQQMSLMPPCGVSVCLLSRVPTVPLVHSYETTLPKYIQYIKRIENRQKERERERVADSLYAVNLCVAVCETVRT